MAAAYTSFLLDIHIPCWGTFRPRVPQLDLHPYHPLAEPLAQLQPIRFGEFLRDRNLITEEQWLAALAEHWSVRGFTIGEMIARHGYLPAHEIEREARAFHDLDIVEVDESLR
jgi:hypothetical protein